MDLYLCGVLFVMGFFSTEDNGDTWKDVFKFILISLGSWFSIGMIFGMYFHKRKEGE